MLATIHSAALQGIDAEPVLVEVNTGEAGAPDLILVGLPDAAVKESEDRVSSALSNSGFHMPRSRTTINLAPGDLRKEGPIYDLPIALGVLTILPTILSPASSASRAPPGRCGEPWRSPCWPGILGNAGCCSRLPPPRKQLSSTVSRSIPCVRSMRPIAFSLGNYP
jgi:hypothetical protein